MTIFDSLNREHGLLRGLASRVEKALKRRRDEEVRGALTALEAALARHEEIEDLVMGPAERASDPALEREMRRTALQHAGLETIREEMRALLSTDGGPGEADGRLAVLAALLVRRLRAHFLSEEKSLWPLLAKRAGRSIERSLANRAERELEELAEELRTIERGE